MYSLNNTPIFLEFLKRVFKFTSIEFRNKYIQRKLFLHSRCKCNEKHCSTVILKSRTCWKENELGVYLFHMNKGIIIINIMENGYLEVETIAYEQYPFKKEIEIFFNNKKIINRGFLRQKKRIKKLLKKDRRSIHKYFWNLKFDNDNVINLGGV